MDASRYQVLSAPAVRGPIDDGIRSSLNATSKTAHALTVSIWKVQFSIGRSFRKPHFVAQIFGGHLPACKPEVWRFSVAQTFEMRFAGAGAYGHTFTAGELPV